MQGRGRVLIVALVVAVGLLVAAAPALSFITGLTADSTATLSVSGTTATVSGTVQCEPGSNAFVAARIVQTSGRSFTEADNFTEIICDGTVQPWSLIITAPLGAKWKPGKAIVGAFAEDGDNEIEIQTTVRLNKG
jgi:hypothetical protein